MRMAGKYAGIVCALAAAGCSGTPGQWETTGSTSDSIIGGTNVNTSYPEAATLNMVAANSATYGCSATLIAPRVVLTAGHCVDGMVAFEVHVGAQTVKSTKGTTYDWHENGATTVNPKHHDVGLIFLDTPIAIAAYPQIAGKPAPDGSKALNVGRIKDGRLTNDLWGAPTTIADGASVGFPLDYWAVDVIEHGDSGGPDFLVGTHTVVAVNSGAGSGAEVLARVDLVADWIRSQVNANGGPGPTGDAGAAAPPSQDAGPPRKGDGDGGALPSSPDAGAPVAPPKKGDGDAGLTPPTPPRPDAGSTPPHDGRDAGSITTPPHPDAGPTPTPPPDAGAKPPSAPDAGRK